MKKLTHSFWAKAAAIFLCTIFSLAAVAFFAMAVYAIEYDRGNLVYSEQWLGNIANLSEVQINWFIGLGVFFTIACAALYVFLLCAAGRREGNEQPQLTRLERVPLDLLCVLFVLAFVLLYLTMQALSYSFYGRLVLLLVAFGMAGTVLLALMLSMTFAVRVKTGTLWRNNIIAYILVFLWRVFLKIVRGISLLWKVILGYVVFGLLCMLLYIPARYGGFAGLLFFLVTVAMLAALCLGALQMQRLQVGAKALAAGDLGHRVDTGGMHLDIKEHAEALNGIGEGMRRAVEERMKSERMKTDLIANVSHDLKTPLTSIVTYIDLLQKQGMEDETARGYVDVLARQAERLKKLTGDIVEASKASSGALGVTLEPTDLKEILHQSLAEYAQRLETAGITPVVKLPDSLPMILADGKLAWRVLDNLLNNACKYALPDTRLYCEAGTADRHVTLTLKNVSRESIGVSGDELMERFVRGDAARSSEGSGLGLSIAKSLMELQKGELHIDADGDLFKATLVFIKTP
ncbi:MAG: MFS domain-containing histidine kinase [Bacillota bacterium]